MAMRGTMKCQVRLWRSGEPRKLELPVGETYPFNKTISDPSHSLAGEIGTLEPFAVFVA